MIRRLDYTGPLSDAAPLAEGLEAAGLSASAAAAKAEMFGRIAEALGSDRPQAAFYVPGRIEVLGKHTDYSGGRTMVAAVERGFVLAVKSIVAGAHKVAGTLRVPSAADGTRSVPATESARVSVVDVVGGESAEFALDGDLTPTAGHWSNYPMTVARRIVRNFPAARCGARIALASDLPPAAGMSSSSALMVAVFLALAEVNELESEPAFRENIHDLVELAGYLGTVENGQTFGTLVGDRGVGTFGGSEDHTAMLCARPGQISQYAYCPVRFERAVPLPLGYGFAVAASGVAAEKTGAAMERYNAASRLAGRIAQLWRAATGRSDPHLAAALASSPEAAGRMYEVLRAASEEEKQTRALLARFEHFVTESEQVVPSAGDALARGDLAEFGRMVDLSQQAAEQLLGNQVPETCALAALARAEGAAAASAFGAGFGGSVWALVEQAGAEAFLNRWAAGYRARHAERAEAAVFFLTAAGPAAFRVT